jgi:hypothetical protein
MGFETPLVDLGVLTWEFVPVMSTENHHLVGGVHIAPCIPLGCMVMEESCHIVLGTRLAQIAIASCHTLADLAHTGLPSHDWVGSSLMGVVCLVYPYKTACHRRSIHPDCGQTRSCWMKRSIHMVMKMEEIAFRFCQLVTMVFGMDVAGFDPNLLTC